MENELLSRNANIKFSNKDDSGKIYIRLATQLNDIKMQLNKQKYLPFHRKMRSY